VLSGLSLFPEKFFLVLLAFIVLLIFLLHHQSFSALTGAYNQKKFSIFVLNFCQKGLLKNFRAKFYRLQS
jgi:hypothetical protein